jgi:PEP-CTERM motif-containing protein
VHTELFPSGEIRGQLSSVPEPATAGLLAVALLLFGAKRFRNIAR